MRFLSAFFFILVLPVLVFLGTCLYGGINSVSIKNNLVTSNAYTLISDQIGQQLDSASQDNTDGSIGAIIAAAKNRITPSYLQQKTEKAIDDSTLWIEGKTTTPPTLSFSEIKDDINAQNPEILPSLQKTMEDFKKQQEELQKEDPNNSSGKAVELNGMGTFIQNGFTIPLENGVKTIKTIRTQIFIAFVVFLVLSLLALLLIFLFSKSLKSKFKYIGVVFIIASVYGYTFTFGLGILSKIVELALKSQDQPAVVYISPILLNLLAVFVGKYKQIQTITSIGLIGLGILFVIISMFMKGAFQSAAPSSKPVKQISKSPSKSPVKKKK